MLASDLLFLAVLATVSVQLGKFFWPNYSFVLGIPIDYRALTFYLSDLVVITYLLFFLLHHAKNLKKNLASRKEIIIVFLIFNLYLFSSAVLTSTSPEASIFFALKFFTLSLLAIFGSITFSSPKVKIVGLYVIIFSLFWQSILVIGQFALQTSLNLWFLGERSFDAQTAGIAQTSIFGTQLLRAYGSFPHPNVAAAFLVVYLIILALSYKKWPLFKILVFVLSSIAIILTFSKAAILALLLSLAVFLKGQKRLLMIALLLVVGIWLALVQLKSAQLASIAERLTLTQAALDIALISPFFGVGSGNFVLELSRLNLFSLAEIRLLQPVHNVFLLILAENGIVGLLIFASLLYVILKNITEFPKLGLLIGLLIFASVDHFLWTLQQGQLLLAISLAYVLSTKNMDRESSLKK